MYFKSDNSGHAAPQIMDAMVAANNGYQGSYGADDIMDRVRNKIREIFEAPEAAVYLVATGTAANSLSLATLVDPWSSIYCADTAHVEWDECGAPEFFTGGAKLVLNPTEAGRMLPDALRARLAEGTNKDVHQVQRGALTITNVTEVGGVYSAAQVAELAGMAKGYGMGVHMDGARFANAIAASNASPAEMTWRAGVDVLSFGGTKNGCVGVEAVVLFDPAKAWEFELRRKRGGHLFSKHRYLSAQMDAYLEDGLWLDLARQANRAGQRLSDGLKAQGKEMLYAQDANMIFAAWSRGDHRRVQAGGGAYYLWPHTADLDGPEGDQVACRLVTNWATTDEDVDRFLSLVAGG